MEREHSQHEIQLLNEKINEKNTYYEQVKLRDKELKKINHDIHKNYRLLYQNILDGNYKNAKEILEAYLKNSIIDRKEYTGIKYIDDILCFKTKINDYNINITYTGNSLNFSKINSIDFNIIFENLIDNAIESCIQCEERKIHIILTHNDNMNIIKVINGCKKAIMKDNNFISTKKDTNNHGLGIEIMKQQTLKYNGEIIFKYNEKISIFTTTIFLPYRK